MPERADQGSRPIAVHHLHLIGMRIKSRSELAHDTRKWLIIGGLLYRILV
jgi:hypothetical protein